MRPGVMNEAPPRLLSESETVRSLSHVSFSIRDSSKNLIVLHKA